MCLTSAPSLKYCILHIISSQGHLVMVKISSMEFLTKQKIATIQISIVFTKIPHKSATIIFMHYKPWFQQPQWLQNNRSPHIRAHPSSGTDPQRLRISWDSCENALFFTYLSAFINYGTKILVDDGRFSHLNCRLRVGDKILSPPSGVALAPIKDAWP